MLSVIVPAYYAEKTLGHCLAALASQTSVDHTVEILVVDDGSTDRTAEVASAYPGVTLIRQAHQGPAAARNTGARKASGEILLFTDADCVPERDWVAEMTAPFADPRVAAVKGAYRTRQTGLIARFAQVEFEERYALLKRQSAIDFVDSYSAAFRTQAFWDVGGFDPAFPCPNNEDVDLSYRLARAGYRMVFNPRAVVYHTHPATFRAYLRVKFWRGYWRMVVYRRFPGKALRDSYTPQTLKLQIALFYTILGAICSKGLGRVENAMPVALALTFLFGGTTVPFALRAGRTDRALGFSSPLLLLARAGAIGLGAAWGLQSVLRGRVDPQVQN